MLTQREPFASTPNVNVFRIFTFFHRRLSNLAWPEWEDWGNQLLLPRHRTPGLRESARVVDEEEERQVMACDVCLRVFFLPCSAVSLRFYLAPTRHLVSSFPSSLVARYRVPSGLDSPTPARLELRRSRTRSRLVPLGVDDALVLAIFFFGGRTSDEFLFLEKDFLDIGGKTRRGDACGKPWEGKSNWDVCLLLLWCGSRNPSWILMGRSFIKQETEHSEEAIRVEKFENLNLDLMRDVRKWGFGRIQIDFEFF